MDIVHSLFTDPHTHTHTQDSAFVRPVISFLIIVVPFYSRSSLRVSGKLEISVSKYASLRAYAGRDSPVNSAGAEHMACVIACFGIRSLEVKLKVEDVHIVVLFMQTCDTTGAEQRSSRAHVLGSSLEMKLKVYNVAHHPVRN